MALGQRRVLDPHGHPPPERQVVPERIPYVSYAVLGLSVLVFGAELLMGVPLLEAFALYGPAVVDGGQWYRVLTTAVTHGSLMHIGFNMWVLWSLGLTFERGIASWRFAMISLVTALGSSAFVLALAYEFPTVGASGMILGWAGAMLPIATDHGRKQLGSWLVQIAIISALPLIFPEIRISWQGHLGGFLFGLPCGLLLRDHARHFKLGMPVLIFLSAVAVVVAGYFGAGR